MSNPETIYPQAILAVMQQRFPRVYEICLQAAYIANLEKELEAKDVNELPDQS